MAVTPLHLAMCTNWPRCKRYLVRWYGYHGLEEQEEESLSSVLRQSRGPATQYPEVVKDDKDSWSDKIDEWCYQESHAVGWLSGIPLAPSPPPPPFHPSSKLASNLEILHPGRASFHSLV